VRTALTASLMLVCGVVSSASGTNSNRPTGAANGPTAVINPTRHDTSPPLLEMTASVAADARSIMPELEVPSGLNALPEGWQGVIGTRHSAHVAQHDRGDRGAMPAPVIDVEGIGKGMPGYAWLTPPPDTTGAVGPDHFLQWVNTHFMLFNLTDGSVVDLPGEDWRSGNTLWAGFGGPCETTNDGDPIVIWDQLAGRWFMSQLAVFHAYPTGPFYQCIAVSTTADPLGSWHRYAYEWPGNKLNDYPKFGLWPDGYYMTVNEFLNSAGNWLWRGAGVAVFERDKMLQGQAASVIYWNLSTAYGVLLPCDLDGTTGPPPGSAACLVGLHIDLTGDDSLNLWHARVDWTDPGASTLGGAGNAPDATIPVSPIDPSAQIDQPGTTDLDVIGDRLMYRAPYRNFGSHESVVLNHTVGVPAGIRWYELRDPNGTPVLHQEGTFSPDAEHRWMGSLAMDKVGNIALGYNLAGPTTAPSIRVAGRSATDPLGEMTLDEHHLRDGSGSQVASQRWGDYSTMAVDPDDDCTLWYTQEYTDSVGMNVWQTRVAAYRFASCVIDEIFTDGFESADTTGWSRTTP
jgi:hypothetical protein